MSESARAFWVTGPGRGEIRSTELPAPRRGEVRVRAVASGVSRGTESLVFHGRVPSSERQRMRCPFQEGEFPAPVKYGYASVGVVEALGPEAPAELLGERVFCLYPHQDRYVASAAAVLPVPAEVPERRTLVAALAARLPGASVEVVDTDPRRAALAEAVACRFASPDRARGDADVVFHASGSEAGLAKALALAGFEARVIELSWYGDGRVAVPLGEAFHARRLQLISSQVGAVATARRARRTHRERLTLALDLLRDAVFDRLISGECSLDALPETMACLASAPNGALCQVVRY